MPLHTDCHGHIYYRHQGANPQLGVHQWPLLANLGGTEVHLRYKPFADHTFAFPQSINRKIDALSHI